MLLRIFRLLSENAHAHCPEKVKFLTVKIFSYLMHGTSRRLLLLNVSRRRLFSAQRVQAGPSRERAFTTSAWSLRNTCTTTSHGRAQSRAAGLTTFSRTFAAGFATDSTMDATSGPNRALSLTNRCGESKSPYVRSHMDNPTAWQLWTPETLELAKKTNRLLFVSIGYSACHW